MEKTVRLFDSDAYLSRFAATVVSSFDEDGRHVALLDRTAFFPDEGGQSPDTGTVSGVRVTYVYEKDGYIYHVTDAPLPVGAAVEGAIDFGSRYRKMQSHTGEHVLCGTAHRLYGAENVGFHLSEEYVRVDLDVYLDADAVERIEREANRAAGENHPVRAWYPEESELERLDYRSKDGIKGAVRLVEIEGVDLCACCAPHVSRTSEIGMIKVVDSIKYKGGTRLWIVCGADAVDLFIKEHASLSSLAESFSVKRDDLTGAIERLRTEAKDAAYRLRAAERKIMKLELAALENTDGAKCFFYGDADSDAVREFLNGAGKKCKIAAGFIGHDGEYTYTVRSDSVPLREFAKEMNGSLAGRGGGTDVMISGRVSASRKEIEEYFSKI